MSYEIVYDKQFIKAKKEEKEVYFPILYCGSNNCIQYDRSSRGRRERGWHNALYICGGKQYATAEEIFSEVARQKQYYIDKYKDTEDQYEDKRFGWFSAFALSGKGTSIGYGEFKGLFKTGIAKSLSVEELRENNISTIVFSYSYDLEKFKKEGFEPFEITVKTSEELVALVDEKTKVFSGSSYNFYVRIDASEEETKRLRKRYFPRKSKYERKRILVSEFFVLAGKTVNGYFVKNTARGFRYSPFDTGGKTFYSEKKAINFKKRMRNGEIFDVKKVVLSANTTISVYE